MTLAQPQRGGPRHGRLDVRDAPERRAGPVVPGHPRCRTPATSASRPSAASSISSSTPGSTGSYSRGTPGPRARGTWSSASCRRDAMIKGRRCRSRSPTASRSPPRRRTSSKVETTLAGAPDEVVLFMPVWTPGSYLVREYARHVEGLMADAPARATKIRKNAWRVEARGAARIVVRYRVYAGELTVRTSHVDETHAFLVGAALFLGVEGHLGAAARVRLDVPAGWRVATRRSRSSDGSYVAADFDTLIDSPIEAGLHREARFDVQGTPHRYSIWPAEAADGPQRGRPGQGHDDDPREGGGALRRRLPVRRSTSSCCTCRRGAAAASNTARAPRSSRRPRRSRREGYLDLLSLVAHEVFHAWNVKRIRPAGLAPYDYQHECYTRQLWWFEGATSYYDWRSHRADAALHRGEVLLEQENRLGAGPPAPPAGSRTSMRRRAASCTPSKRPASTPGSSSTAPTRTPPTAL